MNYILALDTFVWLRQSGPPRGDNIHRLVLAKTADVAAQKWTLFDIDTTMLGVKSAFLDFPDLAICANDRLPHGNPSYTKTPDATRSF